MRNKAQPKEGRKNLRAHSIDGHYLDDRNKLASVYVVLNGRTRRHARRVKGMYYREHLARYGDNLKDSLPPPTIY